MPTLLIIDMQVGMTWPASGARNNPGAESVIRELLESWRARGAPIVHVRHISRTPGSPFWPGQPGVEFQPALVPLDREHVVEKNVPDAFVNTGLERWLHARGETTLVIVGVSTSNSVESTARTAGNLGFTTYVVRPEQPEDQALMRFSRRQACAGSAGMRKCGLVFLQIRRGWQWARRTRASAFRTCFASRWSSC
jgi:nicotinamidase-related amidase